jgi:hypothetical protein
VDRLVDPPALEVVAEGARHLVGQAELPLLGERPCSLGASGAPLIARAAPRGGAAGAEHGAELGSGGAGLVVLQERVVDIAVLRDGLPFLAPQRHDLCQHRQEAAHVLVPPAPRPRALAREVTRAISAARRAGTRRLRS